MKKKHVFLLRLASLFIGLVLASLTHGLLGSPGVSLGLMGGNAAWAKDTAHSALVDGSLTPTKFMVVNDGKNYTEGRNNSSLKAKVHVHAKAGVARRVKSVRAWMAVKNMDRPGGPFSGNGHAYLKRYKVGKKTIDSTIAMTIPQTELAYWLVDQCNAMAREKRESGKGNRDIFSEDRKIRLVVYSVHDVEFSGPGFATPASMPYIPKSSNLTLTCKNRGRRQVPTAGALQRRPRVEKVESVQLFIQPISSLGGTCKVTLKFALKSNYPNVQVKYYFLDEKHHKSDIKTVTTNNVKLAGGTWTYKVPNGPGEEFGKIHMVGVSPNQFISNAVTYRMSCGTDTRGRKSGGRVRSRGIDNLPPPDNHDQEPPPLPKT